MARAAEFTVAPEGATRLLGQVDQSGQGAARRLDDAYSHRSRGGKKREVSQSRLYLPLTKRKGCLIEHEEPSSRVFRALEGRERRGEGR